MRRASPWLTQEFVYPHAHVELHFFRVRALEGVPVGHDGQAFSWQTPGRFDVSPLLPANTRVLAALELPAVYGITCADAMGEDAFLARAARAFAGGLRLVQIREKTWPAARRDAFVARLRDLAAPHGVTLMLNGDADAARALGLPGVHWTSAALRDAKARPHDLRVAASCHTREELARAARLGVDFAVLGPVMPTPSHPGAPALGFEGFAAQVAAARLPVYALGGLTRQDLDAAIDHGAHGVALRRDAWPAA